MPGNVNVDLQSTKPYTELLVTIFTDYYTNLNTLGSSILLSIISIIKACS